MNKTKFFPPLPIIELPVARFLDESELDEFITSPIPFVGEETINSNTLFIEYKIGPDPFRPNIIDGKPFYGEAACYTHKKYKDLLEDPCTLFKIQAWFLKWERQYKGESLHLVICPHIDSLSIHLDTNLKVFKVILNGKITAYWDPYIPDGLSNIQSFKKFYQYLVNLEEREFFEVFGYTPPQKTVELFQSLEKKAKVFISKI